MFWPSDQQQQQPPSGLDPDMLRDYAERLLRLLDEWRDKGDLLRALLERVDSGDLGGDARSQIEEMAHLAKALAERMMDKAAEMEDAANGGGCATPEMNEKILEILRKQKQEEELRKAIEEILKRTNDQAVLRALLEWARKKAAETGQTLQNILAEILKSAETLETQPEVTGIEGAEVGAATAAAAAAAAATSGTQSSSPGGSRGGTGGSGGTSGSSSGSPGGSGVGSVDEPATEELVRESVKGSLDDGYSDALQRVLIASLGEYVTSAEPDELRSLLASVPPEPLNEAISNMTDDQIKAMVEKIETAEVELVDTTPPASGELTPEQPVSAAEVWKYLRENLSPENRERVSQYTDELGLVSTSTRQTSGV